MTEQVKVPEIRFAGFTDPWEQRKLGDVASSFDYGFYAGQQNTMAKICRISPGSDVFLQCIDDETLKSDLTTPLADLAMSADYLIKRANLLFAGTGASVGKTYLYRQFDGMVYFAGFLSVPESAKINPEFAYQATLTDAFSKYVAITSQRSGPSVSMRFNMQIIN